MLKRLAIVVSFRSKFDAKTFSKITITLILLVIIRLERAKGIEPSSPFTFSKSLLCNFVRLLKSLLLNFLFSLLFSPIWRA